MNVWKSGCNNTVFLLDAILKILLRKSNIKDITPNLNQKNFILGWKLKIPLHLHVYKSLLKKIVFISENEMKRFQLWKLLFFESNCLRYSLFQIYYSEEILAHFSTVFML